MIPPGPINSSAPRRGAQASPSANLRLAWQEGQAPDLLSFVTRLSDVSPAELAALIRIDFAARWNQGDRPRPEEYLGLFSAVASDVELAVDIIYAEYLAREQSGERPQLGEYQQRFPAFAHVLAEQIRLHQAIETLDDSPQI